MIYIGANFIHIKYTHIRIRILYTQSMSSRRQKYPNGKVQVDHLGSRHLNAQMVVVFWQNMYHLGNNPNGQMKWEPKW